MGQGPPGFAERGAFSNKGGIIFFPSGPCFLYVFKYLDTVYSKYQMFGNSTCFRLKFTDWIHSLFQHLRFKPNESTEMV